VYVYRHRSPSEFNRFSPLPAALVNLDHLPSTRRQIG